MSTNSDAPLLDPSDTGLQIQQELTGNQNQIIGQAVSSTIVNVTGSGQVTIYQSQLERTLQSESEPAPSAIGPNPYKGLLAFQETDGDRFFGREKQIEQLWQKFRTLQEEASIRMLPIYGPSGSGKSSLARAGLIPELAQRPLPGHDRARVAILVPGTHPLETLATVLARVATDDPTPVAKTREFAEELARANHAGDCDGLRRIADVLPNIATSPLIVLVDQFEEVYTLCGDVAERSAFINNLLCAAGDRSKRVSVIITLRSDFLGETQKHPLLNRLFSQQGFLVPAMDEEELRQAIRQPAALAGHPLDEATVSLLIEQTEGREGALPLLQFALTRIWEGMTEGVAPAVTLECIGGVGGALAGEAQRVYDSLMPVEQAIVRRVFLGLVQLGEGTRDTRRRVAINNLVSYKSDSSQVRRVLSRFTDPSVRLITRAASSEGTETAEVTHEALFDHWQLLNDWLDQSRDDLRFQRRLEDDAQHWEQNGRPDGNLWRPPDLDLLKQYHDRSGDDMTPLEVEFFKASNRAENNRKRLRIMGISVLAGGFLLTTGLMIFAGYQFQNAERLRVEQLTATAEALLLTQPVNAEINALAAVGLSRKAWFRAPNDSVLTPVFSSLLASAQANKERKVLPHKNSVWSAAFNPSGKEIVSGGGDGAIYFWNIDTGEPSRPRIQAHEGKVTAVAFSPDGKTIASSGADGMVRLWNAESGESMYEPLQGHEGIVNSVAFRRDGKMIVSGGADGIVRLWNADNGKLTHQLHGHEGTVSSVVFSVDGKTIASAGADSTVRLWNADTGESIGQLRGHEDTINSVAFSPDGKMLASGSSDKTIRLWDVNSQEPIEQPLRGHEGIVTSVAFSPDGKMLASGSSDRTIRLWDINSQEPIEQPLYGHEDAVSSVAFSRDGKMIVSSGRDLISQDRTVRLWDISNSELIGYPFSNHEDETGWVAFSPDGKKIISGGNNVLCLWDISTGKPIEYPFHGEEQDYIWAVAFSPTGEVIATGNNSGSIRLWDANKREPIGQSLQGHQGAVPAVVFSSNGQRIASGSEDGTIRLWDVNTGKPVGQPMQSHEGWVYTVAFSPNGEIIASGGSDNIIRLWNANTQQLIRQWVGHKDEIWSLAFSPDGMILASGSGNADRTIRLWDVDTGKPIGHSLQGHEKAIWSLVFSSDGKLLVSSSEDKTIRLWDVNKHEPIGYPLRGHKSIVSSVAFNSNEQIIVSDSRDDAMRLWGIESVYLDKVIQIACNQLRYHPSLVQPATPIAEEARQSCQPYAWKDE